MLPLDEELVSLVSGLHVRTTELHAVYLRPFDEKDLERWLDPSTPYGAEFRTKFSEHERKRLQSLMQRYNKAPLWPIFITLLEFYRD